jgi:hypothetical protein
MYNRVGTVWPIQASRQPMVMPCHGCGHGLARSQNQPNPTLSQMLTAIRANGCTLPRPWTTRAERSRMMVQIMSESMWKAFLDGLAKATQVITLANQYQNPPKLYL